ncbi:VOC family protein [soil metagenome]
MIAWLEKAFGFAKRVAYENDTGGIMHAEMVLGAGIIMFGDANPGEFGKHVSTPRDLGGTTQAVYVAVPDADAVFATAKAAGADIIMGLTDQPYGSRDFICKDPEGHVWCFGTYAPVP